MAQATIQKNIDIHSNGWAIHLKNFVICSNSLIYVYKYKMSSVNKIKLHRIDTILKLLNYFIIIVMIGRYYLYGKSLIMFKSFFLRNATKHCSIWQQRKKEQKTFLQLKNEPRYLSLWSKL